MTARITIFSGPKPFTLPHIATIQRNAIRSWLALGAEVDVLLLADSRSPLARGGVERVRSGIGSMHVTIPAGELRLTLSAGMAEHHAGETVEQTLDRAERALDEAKQQGRDRLVPAP